MSNSPMKYIVKSPSHALHIETLRRAEVQSGVYLPNITVILESVRHESDLTIRDDFKAPACFCIRGDAQDGIPSDIASLIADPECDGLIWLSKDLVEGDEIHFSWVFAHELCHVLQRTGVRRVVDLQVRLQAALREHPNLCPGTQLDHADELDSEIFAKRLTRTLFDATSFEAYLQLQRTKPNGAKYHARLELLESSLGSAE